MDQKLLSLKPPLTWLLEVFEMVDNRPPGQTTAGHWYQGLPSGADWSSTLRRSLVLQYFREWATTTKPHGASTYTGSGQRFWSEIHKVIPRHRTSVKDADGNRCVAVSLDELRAYVEAYRQGRAQ